MTVIAWIGGAWACWSPVDADERRDLAGPAPARSSRIQKYAGRGTIKVFSGISHRFDTYEERDRFLALQAPIYLIVILAIWLAALLIGFALMLWPFMKTGGFVHALTVSGSRSSPSIRHRRGSPPGCWCSQQLRRDCGSSLSRSPISRSSTVPSTGESAGHHAGQPGGITRLGP